MMVVSGVLPEELVSTASPGGASSAAVATLSHPTATAAMPQKATRALLLKFAASCLLIASVCTALHTNTLLDSFPSCFKREPFFFSKIWASIV